ncbi:MAG: InlB B-repeat-containing protein, partial [Paludibacteraceae bacterium]|nr:InlB B-repeat-containing protein [Paludibacteraceae bacterium]
MRKILLTLLTTLLCSVTVWGATFSAAQIVAGGSSGNISVSTSVSDLSKAKQCGTTPASANAISLSSGAGSDYTANYIEIKASDGYTISALSLYGAGNSDGTTPTTCIVFWAGDAGTTYASHSTSYTLPDRNITSSGCNAPAVVSVPSGTKTIRLYKQIKVKNNAFDSKGSSTPSSSSTYLITQIEATAASAGDYSITYNCNGGTDCPETATNQANLPNPLPSPTKSGYVLAGWYDNEGLTGDPVVAGATLDDDITLYAKWVTAYTLTWNLNGGKVTTAGTGAAVDATGTPSIALVAGATITTPVVARDYHSFNGWSSTPASTMPSGNTTYTASWTPLYAFGTYMFDGNSSLGTSPNNATCGTGTSSAFRIDNIFFSGSTFEYEDEKGDGYGGWKWKSDGTISFMVENDCDVTVGIGAIGTDGGATISYTNTSGEKQNSISLSASTDNTYSVKGGTVVTIAKSGTKNKTVTLKKIAITTACTSRSVTAATSTGNNTYGTVSAASASVCEGSTTTVTASPASGYQVTNWAVTGTGASVSPSGASNSNTTTLTMGTADATVTVTFGCKAPTSPDITGTTAYTEGQDISLTASASDISASATYTWYKGTTWDAASATSSIHSGATLSINDCVEDNAGTY